MDPILRPARVGIAGTGYVGRGLAMLVEKALGDQLSRILTRRDINTMNGYPRAELLTNSLDELIDHSDLIVECSGDVLYATEVIARAMEAGLPVVTMNAEFHITTGSHFVGQGLLTEAEGDQPGVQAILKEEAELMGFEPIVFANVKTYMNLDPTPEDMAYWSQKMGMRVEQVIQFTDGTKLQIEQALVANGLGADIVQEGMTGPHVVDMDTGAQILGERALNRPRPISDYILSDSGPFGVFLVGKHDAGQKQHLASYKMGGGAFHTIPRPYHLCHFEIPKTIRRVLLGGGVLLDNSAHPRVGVATVAKKALPGGTEIERAIGSYEFRGTTVNIADRPDHVPIGLVTGAVLKHSVEPGQILTFDDVELPDSLALDLYLEIRDRAAGAAGERLGEALPVASD